MAALTDYVDPDVQKVLDALDVGDIWVVRPESKLSDLPLDQENYDVAAGRLGVPVHACDRIIDVVRRLRARSSKV